MNNDRFQIFQHILSPCSMCLIIHSFIEILLIVINKTKKKKKMHEQESKNGIQSTLRTPISTDYKKRNGKYTNKQTNKTGGYKKIN